MAPRGLAALLALALFSAGQAAPGKKVNDAEHKRELEERFAAWRKKSKSSPKLRKLTSKPKITNERPVPAREMEKAPLGLLGTATSSHEASSPVALQEPEQQWQKDYEAFVSTQRLRSKSTGAQQSDLAEAEDPNLVSTLLLGSKSATDSSLAELLGQNEQQELAARKLKFEEQQRYQLRRRKEQEQQKRLQDMKEEKYEEASLQAQDRARKHHERQIHESLAQVEILRTEPQQTSTELEKTSPEPLGYKKWLKGHVNSTAGLTQMGRTGLRALRNGQDTVRMITKEVEGTHRSLFDIVQDLQSQQEKQVEIRRPLENGRFERWQTRKLRQKAKEDKEKKQEEEDEGDGDGDEPQETQLLRLQRAAEAMDPEEAPLPLGRSQKQNKGQHFEAWQRLHFHRRT